MGEWFYWGDANYTGPYAVGAEYQRKAAAYEATESRLKAYDRAYGTNRLSEFRNEEAAKLLETIRRYRAARRK
jgi:hypothetical protein